MIKDVSRNIPPGRLVPLREAASTARPVFTMVYDDAASVRVWLDPSDGAPAALVAKPVARAAVKTARAAMVAGAFAPAAPLEMIHKDLRLAKKAASDTPGLSAFAEIYANASAKGSGKLNATAFARRYLPV